MVYASNTDVSTDKSRIEIERTLDRYGADGFAYARTPDMAEIRFRFQGKLVRIPLALPNRESKEFQRTPERGLARTKAAAYDAWEQACRQRWRALLLVIKAKLEATLIGITTFDEEFLAFLVLPNNTTVGDLMLPQIEEAYQSGKMPQKMLSAGLE